MPEGNFYLNSYKKNTQGSGTSSDETSDLSNNRDDRPGIVLGNKDLKTLHIDESNSDKLKAVKPFSFERLERIPIEEKPSEPLKSRTEVIRPVVEPSVGSGQSGFIPRDDVTPIPKRRLAAIFLLAIGLDKASKVVKSFEEGELYSIAAEIISISGVTESEVLLTEKFFGKLNLVNPQGLTGSKEFVRNLLSTAFGIARGSELFVRTLEFKNERKFQFLESFTPEQVVDILKEEHSSVISIILGLTNSKFTAKIIQLLPREIAVEVVKRFSTKLDIQPEILDTITAKIKEKTSKIRRDETIEINGNKKLLDLLKYMDPKAGGQIISDLEKFDDKLARDIKDKIFTFNDIALIPRKSLEIALKGTEDKDIALMLKGADDITKGLFLGCISKRRREIVESEIKLMGGVKQEDVNFKRREFVFFLRQLENDGKLDLTIDRDKYVY